MEIMDEKWMRDIYMQAKIDLIIEKVQLSKVYGTKVLTILWL